MLQSKLVGKWDIQQANSLAPINFNPLLSPWPHKETYSIGDKPKARLVGQTNLTILDNTPKLNRHYLHLIELENDEVITAKLFHLQAPE